MRPLTDTLLRTPLNLGRSRPRTASPLFCFCEVIFFRFRLRLPKMAPVPDTGHEHDFFVRSLDRLVPALAPPARST